jgi:hypothetical protein
MRFTCAAAGSRGVDLCLIPVGVRDIPRRLLYRRIEGVARIVREHIPDHMSIGLCVTIVWNLLALEQIGFQEFNDDITRTVGAVCIEAL